MRSHARPTATAALLLAFVGLLYSSQPVWSQTVPPRRAAFEAVYEPTAGLRVTSPDRLLEIRVPDGVALEALTFAYERISVVPPAGSVRLAHAFRLQAQTMRGARPVTRFKKPIRLTVAYEDADLTALGVPAAGLRLYYQEPGGQWVPIASSVDSAARIVAADVDHLTDFGLGAEGGGAISAVMATAIPEPTATPLASGATDAFARPDDPNSLGQALSGQRWQTDGTTWGVCGGAGCVGGPASTDAYVRVNTQLSRQRIATTILARPVGAIGQGGLVAGLTGDWNTNLLYVGLDSTGAVEVWTLTGGGTWSAGPIASASTGMSATVARRLEARLAGSTLTVLIDNTTVLGPVTVPAVPATGTWAGLYASTFDPSAANWPRFDDFTVEVEP